MQRQSGSTFLPLRVNSAGMIPLIFAFSIIILPATVASYFRNPLSDDFFSRLARFLSDTLDPTNFPYWAAVFVLVVIFTFFYTLVTFQQQNLAETLQRNGGFIPGNLVGNEHLGFDRFIEAPMVQSGYFPDHHELVVTVLKGVSYRIDSWKQPVSQYFRDHGCDGCSARVCTYELPSAKVCL